MARPGVDTGICTTAGRRQGPAASFGNPKREATVQWGWWYARKFYYF